MFRRERRGTAEAVSRIADLEVALAEAIDLAAEGWGYADDYFRTKWHAHPRQEALTAVWAGARVPRLPDGRVAPGWPFPWHERLLGREERAR